MYNNLLFGVKRRILDEAADAFLNHPAFTEKVEVFNKFPYERRVQYGVILRNSSASQIRMSPDNYLADLNSHVRLARDKNYPGIGIEWVRENTVDITKWICDEDLSSQVDPTQRLFHTAKQIVAGKGDTTCAVGTRQIEVKINGVPAGIEYVNGKKQEFVLSYPPHAGDTLKVSYFAKNCDPPGIYVVDFTEDNQIVVGPIYIELEEVLSESTTGLETTVSLAHTLIYPETDDIVLKYPNSKIDNQMLIRGVDYSIDNATGVITFLHAVPAGYKMLADYRWQPGYSLGPFTFKDYQEIHEAIVGVVLCMGRRAKKGDRQVVITSEQREPQAMIYGGHWDMSLSLGVIAKDPSQMEEMTDQIVNYLWAVRKNVMEFEGITLNRVEPTGESEETFIETTGDLYYESAVDISVMTEWQRFVPHLFTIRHINVNTMPLAPDTREVIKYPTIGYERVI